MKRLALELDGSQMREPRDRPRHQRFGGELATRQHMPRVREDIESGASSSVHSTPTFFVNGVQHQGGYDFDSLREALFATQHVAG